MGGGRLVIRQGTTAIVNGRAERLQGHGPMTRDALVSVSIYPLRFDRGRIKKGWKERVALKERDIQPIEIMARPIKDPVDLIWMVHYSRCPVPRGGVFARKELGIRACFRKIYTSRVEEVNFGQADQRNPSLTKRLLCDAPATTSNRPPMIVKQFQQRAFKSFGDTERTNATLWIKSTISTAAKVQWWPLGSRRAINRMKPEESTGYMAAEMRQRNLVKLGLRGWWVEPTSCFLPHRIWRERPLCPLRQPATGPEATDRPTDAWALENSVSPAIHPSFGKSVARPVHPEVRPRQA